MSGNLQGAQVMIPAWLRPFDPRRLRRFRASYDVARSVWFDYGHLSSVRREACVDREGNPVPWYTYPAIDYLNQLDLRAASVFEYGAGNSTRFWSRTASRVVSVDDDPDWYKVLAPTLPPNCDLTLETDLKVFPEVLRRTGAQFDIIVVDGAARGNTRLKCSRVAVEHLRPGGMIVLDNSDWLPMSAAFLRESGLIEVDMTGFGPINKYAWTTSFFLHRACAFAPRGPRQPMPGPASRVQVWELPPSTEPPLVEFDGEVFGAVRRDERFTVASPAGERRFRFIVSEMREHGLRRVAILDEHRGRVLLSNDEWIDKPAGLEERLGRARHMTWDDFQRFINSSDQRRYDLDATAATTISSPG